MSRLIFLVSRFWLAVFLAFQCSIGAASAQNPEYSAAVMGSTIIVKMTPTKDILVSWSENGRLLARVYFRGSPINIRPPDGLSFMNIQGMNSALQVIGALVMNASGYPRHPFLLSDGGFIDLFQGLNESGYAVDVNERGQAVGYIIRSSGTFESFLYSEGKLQFLPTLGGSSRAQAINAVGEIVGISDLANSSGSHGSLYYQGKLIDLGTFGGKYSAALDINDAGYVVGYADDASGKTIPFVRLRQTLYKLKGLTAAEGSGEADSINNKGYIVGQESNKAVLWRSPRDTARDLNKLIAPDPAKKLLRAYRIFEEGTILVSGTYKGVSENFVLTPILCQCASDMGGGE